MSVSPIRVLLDIDGVCCDWLTGAFDIIEEITGVRYRTEDLPSWEVFDHVGREHEAPCYRRFREQGFCASLLPYAGAVDGVARLRSIADVHVVTSPIHGRHWYFERVEWVRRHLGIEPSYVCFTKHKHLVSGDILIDDRVRHVEEWAAAHPKGIGVIWNVPYNENEPLHANVNNVRRVRSWEGAVQLVLELDRLRAPPRVPRRSTLLGSGRDPTQSLASELGAGMSMPVPRRAPR